MVQDSVSEIGLPASGQADLLAIYTYNPWLLRFVSRPMRELGRNTCNISSQIPRRCLKFLTFWYVLVEESQHLGFRVCGCLQFGSRMRPSSKGGKKSEADQVGSCDSNSFKHVQTSNCGGTAECKFTACDASAGCVACFASYLTYHHQLFTALAQEKQVGGILQNESF